MSTKPIAVVVLLLGACARAPVPLQKEAVEPEVAKAEQAFGALKARLMTRLTTAIAEGGPAGAIGVCSTEAKQMTEELGREHGLQLGRTSFRLRNQDNAPRPWAREHVASAQPGPAFVDLSDRVGVLQPMKLAALCVTCHGPRESLAPEVTAALAVQYPGDQAVGFADGDLRGYFWAEVPRQPR